MSDTKNGWLAKDGWVKRVQNVNEIEIHYIENTRTGEKTDFKFIENTRTGEKTDFKFKD